MIIRHPLLSGNNTVPPIPPPHPPHTHPERKLGNFSYRMVSCIFMVSNYDDTNVKQHQKNQSSIMCWGVTQTSAEKTSSVAMGSWQHAMFKQPSGPLGISEWCL